LGGVTGASVGSGITQDMRYTGSDEKPIE